MPLFKAFNCAVRVFVYIVCVSCTYICERWDLCADTYCAEFRDLCIVCLGGGRDYVRLLSLSCVVCEVGGETMSGNKCEVSSVVYIPHTLVYSSLVQSSNSVV